MHGPDKRAIIRSALASRLQRSPNIRSDKLEAILDHAVTRLQVRIIPGRGTGVREQDIQRFLDEVGQRPGWSTSTAESTAPVETPLQRLARANREAEQRREQQKAERAAEADNEPPPAGLTPIQKLRRANDQNATWVTDENGFQRRNS